MADEGSAGCGAASPTNLTPSREAPLGGLHGARVASTGTSEERSDCEPSAANNAGWGGGRSTPSAEADRPTAIDCWRQHSNKEVKAITT